MKDEKQQRKERKNYERRENEGEKEEARKKVGLRI